MGIRSFGAATTMKKEKKKKKEEEEKEEEEERWYLAYVRAPLYDISTQKGDKIII